MSGDDLRALLAGDQVVHAPGVYDPLTASLAVKAGHRAVHLSGAAVSAVALGRPDIPVGNATLIADRAATLATALGGVPLLADADAGFGDPRQAVWTALAYARAGISGLVLRNATADIVAALVAEVPDLALVADIGGGDALLTDDLAHAPPGVPLVVGDPAPDADLAGVRLVLHPLAALLAAMRAASLAYRAILDHGAAEPVDRLPMATFTTLIERSVEHGAQQSQTDATRRIET